jgi:hypothetical protein
VRVTWCAQEGGCRGGFCPGALEWAGRQTMGLTIPAEEGRRPADVVQLFTVKLCQARPMDVDGVARLSPYQAEYVIHTAQDAEGGTHWMALYSGAVPVTDLVATQPEWDEVRAAEQTAAALEALREERERERLEDARPAERRRW